MPLGPPPPPPGAIPVLGPALTPQAESPAQEAPAPAAVLSTLANAAGDAAGATSAGTEPVEGPLRRYSARPPEFATENYEDTIRSRSLAATQQAEAEARENVRLALVGNAGLPEYYGVSETPAVPETPAIAAIEPPAPPAQAPPALPEAVQVAEIVSTIPPSFEEYQELPSPAGYQPINPAQNYPPQPASTTPQVFATQPVPAQTYAPQPAAPIGNGPVTIALLTPNSDPRDSVKALARDLAQAASLAAKDIGDRQLVLRGYDTAGTPERAALAAEQAIADGAQLIIGPLFSGSAAAVAQVAGSYGVNVIAFTTDRSVLRRGLYTMGFLPETEMDRIVSYAAKRGIRSMAALAPDTPYGGLIYAGVNEAGNRHGVQVSRVQAFSPNFDAMDQTAQEFADFYKTAPDLGGLLMVASGKSLQALSAYLAYRDVLPSKIKFMGLGLWDDPETFREATLRGGWFPGIDPAKKAAFESRFQSAAGNAPAPIATLGYDGVVVAAALLDEARQGNPAPFSAESLERARGYDGMSGLFRLRPDGRNERQLAILEVGRRAFSVVDAAPTNFGEQVTRLGGYSQ